MYHTSQIIDSTESLFRPIHYFLKENPHHQIVHLMNIEILASYFLSVEELLYVFLLFLYKYDRFVMIILQMQK